MWLMMFLSYIAVAYIDTKGLKKLNDKGLKPFYMALMAISCAIGTISGYAPDMPSPIEPIKKLVLSLFYN